MTSNAPATSPARAVELVRVSGDHRQMGRQQGAALRALVHAAEEILVGSEPFGLLRPRLLPTPLFAAIARRRARGLLAGGLARHRPEQHERLLGIAEGAGVSPLAGYLVQGAELLLAAVDWRLGLHLSACSTAGVRGPRARDGVAVHHNFDYPLFVQPLLVPRESRPSRGLAALEMTGAPLAGAIDGVNEAGLAIAYDYAFATDASPDPLPLTIAISAALERCRNAAEAVDFLSAHPRSGGALLLVADAGGELVSLELSATRAAVRRPGEGQDAICHANRYATPALQEVEVPGDAVFTDRAVAALRGTRVHASSDARHAALDAALARSPAPLDGASLQTLFSDHGATNAGSDDTICRHGSYWQTDAMIQLFPRQRRMRIAFDAPCRALPAEFAL